MGDGHDFKLLDPGEVRRVAGVHSQSVSPGRGGNHRVEGPSGRFAAAATQRGSDLPERPRCRCIEWERIEIRLGLLETRLSSRTLRIVLRHEGTY